MGASRGTLPSRVEQDAIVERLDAADEKVADAGLSARSLPPFVSACAMTF